MLLLTKIDNVFHSQKILIDCKFLNFLLLQTKTDSSFFYQTVKIVPLKSQVSTNKKLVYLC